VLDLGDALPALRQDPWYQTLLQQEIAHPKHPAGSAPWVHKRLMALWEEPVEHHPQALDGYIPNVQSISAPLYRPKHLTPCIPKDTWDRFFTELDAWSGPDREIFDRAIAGSGVEAMWREMMALKEDAVLLSWIDPQGALTIPKDRYVSGDSYKLRLILDRLNQLFDPAQFAQLLVNILTCPQGKVEGVEVTYRLLGIAMDVEVDPHHPEAALMTMGGFMDHEMIRLRRLMLSQWKPWRNGNEQVHTAYWLDYVLGKDLRLRFQDETPEYDRYGHLVDKDLPKQTRQQLLDTFYEKYTVDVIVHRFEKLLADQNIGLVELTGSQNFYSRLIEAFNLGRALSIEDEWGEFSHWNPEYVIYDEASKKIQGFTPKTLKELLVILGVLNRVA
jgi:hypothetical protein